MSSFTERLRVLSERIVREHFADETPLFEHVWNALLSRLGGERIEDIENPPSWTGSGPVQPLGAIGDAGGQALDSMFVIGSLIGAAITLLRDGQNSLINTAQVRTALQKEAARMEAPARVRKVLESYGTGLLAEHFAALDWLGGPENRAQRKPSGYCVEWCDRAVAPEPLTLSHEVLDRDEVRERFQRQSDQYTLYVDETTAALHVSGGVNRWGALCARHRRFLYLVLIAFQRSGIIEHGQIAKTALQNNFIRDVAIRRVKSETNTFLGEALNGFVTANRGMGHYEVTLVPYCWIRFNGAESRLLG